VGWLIDTSIWIAVERGTLAAADIHAVTRQDPVYLSPVNVAEIRFGLERSFAGAARHDAAFARELPRFLAAIWRVFNEYELAGYVAMQKPTVRRQLRALLYFS
jgi:predicted nucleic acid-binding protein